MFLFLILVFLSLKHIEVKAQDGYHNEVKYKVEAGEGNGSLNFSHMLQPKQSQQIKCKNRI